MLQSTAERARAAYGFAAPFVVAGEDHRFLIADQLSEAGFAATIILEPQGRNTAPAIALAASLQALEDEDALLLVMPSDHVIADLDSFHRAVAIAAPAAREGALVTFGIRPTRAETGYGYIEMGAAVSDIVGVHRVACFVEKPDLAAASTYIASGKHVWNGGIFMFSARSYLEALARYAPEVSAACDEAIAGAVRDGAFVRPKREAFLASPNISVDYAVMERTDRAVVVPVEMGWSDVGSWDALWEISPKDDAGNVISGDVVAVGAKGCLFRADGGPLIAALGVEDVVVVSTRDAVLVVPRSRSQDVKLLVDRLKALGDERYQTHAVVHRPWGPYESTDQGGRFQTKRIVVKPGHKLSLQMHHHRAEHWIIVSGTAKVTVGDEVILLQENQSTYIPAGTAHRLENPGRIPLHLIEVQCGPYLGEDDIVRFDDSYGRINTTA
jgi:mannose-1-phosphate guanylyltransferase/mannose-6-phosphate isomerase